MNKAEQAKQGLEFAMNAANCISVSGIENCKALTLIYNNLNIFLSMLASGQLEIVETKSQEE